ncbi:homeobox-domain-containing protein [Agrocybe pediades]|nr:homeobox-domain-containing protein [Agrocybe pediades]
MDPNSFPPPLSRTSSSASFSSEDDGLSSSTVTVMNSSRRTRKRFTNVQLTMLENLFHQNSHPSREDRESVANAGGMEIKSVTIWFQNKRQTERKTAASNTGANTTSNSNVVPNITSTIHTFSLHNSQSTSRTASPPFSVSSRSTTSSTTSSRPSLDRVASRSELRVGAPRTPSRRPNTTGAIWDNMPSSPLAPPISPPAREFIEFGNARSRRTLEWACAAARLADKDGYASGFSAGLSASASLDSIPSHSRSKTRPVRREKSYNHHRPSQRHSQSTDADLTDEDDQEAITPPSTWGKDDKRWKTKSEDGHTSLMTMTEAATTGELPKGVEDDAMFKAALALCGLGRRT